LINTLAVTGHRPDKIGGYNPQSPLRVWVKEQLRVKLLELQPTNAISGMALGVDQDFAELCAELNIPFIAAIPFVGQDRVWPADSRIAYARLLTQATSQVVVSPGAYAPWKMQRRNEWMVDQCDCLLAVWDGSNGGTANCVRYAEEIGRQLVRINPRHTIESVASA
jgi:uncharacterized phage-like protein YoqJ